VEINQQTALQQLSFIENERKTLLITLTEMNNIFKAITNERIIRKCFGKLLCAIRKRTQ